MSEDKVQYEYELRITNPDLLTIDDIAIDLRKFYHVKELERNNTALYFSLPEAVLDIYATLGYSPTAVHITTTSTDPTNFSRELQQ